MWQKLSISLKHCPYQQAFLVYFGVKHGAMRSEQSEKNRCRLALWENLINCLGFEGFLDRDLKIVLFETFLLKKFQVKLQKRGIFFI